MRLIDWGYEMRWTDYIFGLALPVTAFVSIWGATIWHANYVKQVESKELTVNVESMDQLALNYLIKEAEEQSMEFQALTREIQEIKTELVKLRKDLKK